MALRVVWSRRAVQDLESIAGFIASDSPTYAAAVVKNIVNQIKKLPRFPHLGRKVPEFDNEDIREIVRYNYRVIYRLEAEAIVIAAVVHGKRPLQ